MKKMIIRTLVAVFLALGLAPILATPAFAADPVLGISGTVTDVDTGKPVAGATVLVYCDGVLVLDSSTDGDGGYSAPYDNRCRVGGTLTVTASKDDKSDSSTSTMGDVNVVDLQLKTTISIPEYGWVSGFLAGSVAIGAVIVIRSRNATF